MSLTMVRSARGHTLLRRPLPALVLERDGGGSLLRRYVHGADLISVSSGAGESYFHYDGLGSVVNVTDAAGGTDWTLQMSVNDRPPLPLARFLSSRLRRGIRVRSSPTMFPNLLFRWRVKRSRPSFEKAGNTLNPDLAFGHIDCKRDNLALISLNRISIKVVEENHGQHCRPFIAVKKRMVSNQRVHHGGRLRVDVGVGISLEDRLLGTKNG